MTIYKCTNCGEMCLYNDGLESMNFPDYCPYESCSSDWRKLDAEDYARHDVKQTMKLIAQNNIRQDVEKLIEKYSENDVVNHPSHYAEGRKYEPIDVIEDWDLGFNLGNTVKYISRAGRKDDIVQDLEKARWYLDREIRRIKRTDEMGNDEE